MKKTAIVTGASSGIGEAISKVLCELGYEVYGFGRDFHEEGLCHEVSQKSTSVDKKASQGSTFRNERRSMKPDTKNYSAQLDKAHVDDKSPTSENTPANEQISSLETSKKNMESDHFHPIVCDLLDTDALLAQIKEIRACHELHILVNNAGVGYYGLHEELNPAKIQMMVRTNLELPMLLTQQLLRELKKTKGTIFNISSITAGQSNPHGCAYGATKAGLASFSKSLFDETRKYGVKVVNIQPDMTQTNLYRNADFMEGREPESYLLPSEVADAVRYVLQQRNGTVITEISLRPQIHRIRRKKD